MKLKKCFLKKVLGVTTVTALLLSCGGKVTSNNVDTTQDLFAASQNNTAALKTTTTAYVYAGNMRIAREENTGHRVYMHRDHLSSVSLETDDKGVKQTLVHYSPFGEPLTATNVRYLYNGKERENGVYDYHFRHYDAGNANRFIKADDIQPDLVNPQSLDPYAYVDNNPIRYTDLTGHCKEEEKKDGKCPDKVAKNETTKTDSSTQSNNKAQPANQDQTKAVPCTGEKCKQPQHNKIPLKNPVKDGTVNNYSNATIYASGNPSEQPGNTSQVHVPVPPHQEGALFDAKGETSTDTDAVYPPPGSIFFDVLDNKTTVGDSAVIKIGGGVVEVRGEPGALTFRVKGLFGFFTTKLLTPIQARWEDRGFVNKYNQKK